MKTKVLAGTFCILLSTLSLPATAVPMHYLLTESDPGGLNNAFLREFADETALLNLSQSTTYDLVPSSTPTSSINGMTWAGDRFLMLVEGDPGVGGVLLREFLTFTDLVNANPVVSTFLGSSVGGSGVSIGGLSWDGDRFYMVTESDPGGLGNVFLREFATLADLRSLNQTGVSLIGTDIGGSGVSVTGLNFDGDDWHMLTESDPGGLGNVFRRRFDTLADLKNLNQQGADLLGTNIGGTGVSTHSYFTYDDSVPPITPVPVPASSLLLLFGLSGLLFSSKSTASAHSHQSPQKQSYPR